MTPTSAGQRKQGVALPTPHLSPRGIVFYQRWELISAIPGVSAD
jgi:hypothetical protein